MGDPGGHDEAIQAFAGRFSALFADLTRAIQLDPKSTRITAGAGKALVKGDVVVNLPPESVLERLAAGRVVQVFPTVDRLLHFLTRPGVQAVIEHPSYQPILALPVEWATHIQEILSKCPAREWPWA